MNDLVKAKDGLGYNGSVKISIKAGKRTLASRTIHNNGTQNLFRFLSNCLAGDLRSDMLPRRIRLYTIVKDTSGNPSEKAADESDWEWSNATAISPYVYMASSAVTYTEQTTKAQTTYVFRVPYSQITGNEIYKLALYADTTSNPKSDRYAYIVLREKEDEKWVWAPIKFDKNTRKYAIEIEWTLEISNKDGVSTN